MKVSAPEVCGTGTRSRESVKSARIVAGRTRGGLWHGRDRRRTQGPFTDGSDKSRLSSNSIMNKRGQFRTVQASFHSRPTTETESGTLFSFMQRPSVS
jgi:hypothetical protein